MNFFKKIFSSKKVSFNDISQIKQNLSIHLIKLIEKLDEINTAELDKNMNKRLYSVVKESRSKFTIKIQQNLEDIKITDNDDYESLKEMHSSLIFIVESVGKGNPKYGYYLDFVFRNKMNLVEKQFQLFVSAVNELEKYLKDIEEKRAPVEREKFLELEIPIFEEKKSSLEKKLSELINRKKFKQEKIVELRESMKITESDTLAKISKLNKEKREISSKIFILIDSIKRALRKYEKQGVFEKSTAKMLEKYIDNPVKAACLDNGAQLCIITGDLMKLIESNQLDLKESVKIKVRELSKHLNDIPLFVKKINEAEKEIDSLKKVHRIEENKLIHLKEDIKNSETSILVIDREIKFTEKEMNETNEKLGKLKKELENLIT